jgi:hypothetical protein
LQAETEINNFISSNNKREQYFYILQKLFASGREGVFHSGRHCCRIHGNNPEVVPEDITVSHPIRVKQFIIIRIYVEKETDVEIEIKFS